MEELEQKLSKMSYDDLANLGIRLARIIDRGNECGASSKEEHQKLLIVDKLLLRQHPRT